MLLQQVYVPFTQASVVNLNSGKLGKIYTYNRISYICLEKYYKYLVFYTNLLGLYDVYITSLVFNCFMYIGFMRSFKPCVTHREIWILPSSL